MKSRNPKQPRGLRKRLRREFSESPQCGQLWLIPQQFWIKTQWVMRGGPVVTRMDTPQLKDICYKVYE